MHELNMLVWLTQLGLSVAIPLAGFTMLGIWLHDRFGLGAWVVVCGCILGLIGAINGLRDSLKMMERMDRQKDSHKKRPPSVLPNDAKKKGGK